MMKLLKCTLLIGLLAAAFSPSCLFAQSTTHTVRKGETLFSISQEYNVDVQQLKQWNNLKSNELSIGESLVIKKEVITKNSADKKSFKTHTVKKNETLFSISKKHQVTIAELKSWNNLESNNLNIGQILKIFPSEAPSPPQEPVATTGKTQENSYYTVKNNDSLYGIAHRHGMKVSELKKLNDLSSNTIRVGQKLTVRSTSSVSSAGTGSPSAAQGKFMQYTVRSESILVSDFVSKFQMDEEEFRALNTDIRSSQLKKGQEVIVLLPPTKTFKNPYAKSQRAVSSLGTITASKYKNKNMASPTTSGELYNPKALTGAHSSIALGSVIFVESPVTPYGVFVRINDRISGNKLKLSSAAWKALQISENNSKVTIYQN